MVPAASFHIILCQLKILFFGYESYLCYTRCKFGVYQMARWRDIEFSNGSSEISLFLNRIAWNECVDIIIDGYEIWNMNGIKFILLYLYSFCKIRNELLPGKCLIKFNKVLWKSHNKSFGKFNADNDTFYSIRFHNNN